MYNSNVSVIIPAYRAASTIRRAVDSVLAQTTPAQEIIVVDDGSPDGLAAIVEQYSSPIKLIRIANSKTATARNVGIEAATGDFIAFLDADDYWEPCKLESQLAVFSQHPQVGIVAGRFRMEELSGQSCLSSLKNGYYDRVLSVGKGQAFLTGALMWTGTVIVRRQTLGDYRFVSGLEPAEDRDLWVRLAASAPVYLMSQPLATAVMEACGISRQTISGDCARMLEVVDRHRNLLSGAARRKWRSYVCYRWAAIETSPRRAFPIMLKSFVQWPAPYVGLPSMESWGRCRRTLTILKQFAMEFNTLHPRGGSL